MKEDSYLVNVNDVYNNIFIFKKNKIIQYVHIYLTYATPYKNQAKYGTFP